MHFLNNVIEVLMIVNQVVPPENNVNRFLGMIKRISKSCPVLCSAIS